MKKSLNPCLNKAILSHYVCEKLFKQCEAFWLFFCLFVTNKIHKLYMHNSFYLLNIWNIAFSLKPIVACGLLLQKATLKYLRSVKNK